MPKLPHAATQNLQTPNSPYRTLAPAAKLDYPCRRNSSEKGFNIPDSRAQLYRNLAMMLDAGMPIVRAVKTTAKGLQGPLPKTFSHIAEDLSRGEPLTEAIAARKKNFSPLEITTIEAAERSGDLPETLNSLAHWYEFRNRMKASIKSRLWFPAIILHLGAFIAPLPECLLNDFNFEGYSISVLMILLPFYIPAAIIFFIIRFTPSYGLLRKKLDCFTVRLPVIGKVLLHLALSRFSRAFSILSKAGVPAIESIEKAAAASGNSAIAQTFQPAAECARRGDPISEGLPQNLPLEFTNLWQIGEETGDLDKVTDRLAEHHGYEAERAIERLSYWLPRIIYGLICVMLIYHIIKGYSTLYGTVLSI